MVWYARSYPFVNKALGLLGPKDGLQSAAVCQETIHPAERSDARSVIMLEDDWEAITAIQAETTFEIEQQRVAGGLRDHQATQRYMLRNVLATPRGFYTLGGSFSQYGPPDLRDLLTGQMVTCDRGFFAPSAISMKYFGHWLTDTLPTALLCGEDEALYLPPNPAWPHSTAYLETLGLETISAPLVFFREMSFCIDIGQNTHRQARQRRIRKRITAALGPGNGGAGVFILRGQSGVDRVLVNEAALAARFATRGFKVCASSDPLPKLLAAVRGAPIVISMEGSHVAHALFAAAPDALLVTLNPTDRFNNVYADYLAGLGLRMATLVVPREARGYYADPDRLDRLIDLAQAHAGSE